MRRTSPLPAHRRAPGSDAADRATRAQLESAVTRLQNVQAVADIAIADLPLDPLLNELLGRIRAVLAADEATILLIDESGEHLVARASVGLEEDVAEGLRIPLGVGITGRIAASGQPIVVDDVSLTDSVSTALRERVRSLLGVPLRVKDLVIGVLHVGTIAPREFTREDLHLLELAADRAALAIERARLHQEVVETATRYRMVSQLTSDFAYAIAVEPDGSIEFEWASGALERLTGFSKTEANIAGLLNMVHADDLPGLRSDIQRVLAGEESSRELRIVTSDGRERWVHGWGRPEWDEGHTRVIRIWGAIQDVTARHDAEESLRDALDSLRQADLQRRLLLARLVRSQEEERRRVASDVHDDSLQVMTAVGMRLQMLRQTLPEGAQEAGLRALEEAVSGAIGRLRKLVFDLRPQTLDSEGLAAALRLCLRELERETGVACTLDSTVAEELDPDARTVLYRVAQEALANARKHANPGRIEVLLEEHGGGILAKIRDDGVGFAPDQVDVARPGHLGLSDMRERLEMAGGWFRVESSPGDGTTVSCWVPLTRAP